MRDMYAIKFVEYAAKFVEAVNEKELSMPLGLLKQCMRDNAAPAACVVVVF